MNIDRSHPLRKTPTHSDLSAKETPEVPKKTFREVFQHARLNRNAPQRDLPQRRKLREDGNSAHCKSENQNSLCALQEMLTISAADTKESLLLPAIKTCALSAEMEAAFEKMASCMIVMDASKDMETTLFLDNPHFASSALFGTQITIREFSTAPKAFNIEILSNPTGVALIDASKNDLLSAFRDGNFNFTVNRFDTHIEQTPDRPVFHRKEQGDQQEQRGGQKQ